MSFLEDGLISEPGFDDDEAKKSGDDGTGFWDCDCDWDCELDALAWARLRMGDSDMEKSG